ncbi:MAG: hypothetical protein RBR14_05605 [Candidatus Cloacimonas acidaminovorans]|jgi:hypothetical protein|nr:hypothetical protein [Candidatus Cloacimonas acidaminovorans]
MKEFYNSLPSELQKIIKGFTIALLGALATYLQSFAYNFSSQETVLLATAINSALVNAIRMYIIYLSTK